jgi:Cd2+/Zn2+-exporting ATPase
MNELNTASGFQRIRYHVAGMDCASCGSKIETAIRRLVGVVDVSVAVSSSIMTVDISQDATVKNAVERQVIQLGYGIAPADAFTPQNNSGTLDGYFHSHSREQTSAVVWWQTKRGLLTIVCGVALLAAYAISKAVPFAEQGAFLVAMAIGLIPIARRAFVAAFAGTPFSIEMLMTIAAVGAVVIGATEEAAVVVFLFLVGELLEGIAASRARASIQSLTRLLPKTALLEHEGGLKEVPTENLQVGSLIVVRPGERIPADGTIVEGQSEIDEAPVTGESTPIPKGPQAAVFAGTINTNTVLRIRVTATAADNTIARIVALVEEAQESKAPTERFIDRFSHYYTPGVVAAGAVIAVGPPLLFGAVWSEWIYKGLAILLIGCPCALVISTPAAIAAGLSAGARRGLLMKGGAVLETIGKVTVAAFDKTGTLTEGTPKVTDIIAESRSERDVLSLAAALEMGSNHPLAISILARVKADGVPVPPAANVTALGGKGITGNVGGEVLFLASPRAASEKTKLTPDQNARLSTLNDEGKTVSVLLVGGKVAGFVAMRDEPKADAAAGIRALSAAGVESIMLTGDNRRTAASIAKLLGVEPRAELLPEQKQKIVRELQKQGKIVAKIGDGINDAPALAAANVGIAMGGGTDIALETADAAVLHGRVTDVSRMVTLAKQVMTNIHQNITIALGLKAVFLVTTIVGITGLWPAILADTGATVLVTFNALRLLGYKYEVK